MNAQHGHKRNELFIRQKRRTDERMAEKNHWMVGWRGGGSEEQQNGN